MNDILSNLWPVHAIAWFVCVMIGLVLGYFLASVTESILLNALILLGIVASSSFAFAQGIATGLEIQFVDWTSFDALFDAWLNVNDSGWVTDAEIWRSAAVGSGLCFVVGVATQIGRKVSA